MMSAHTYIPSLLLRVRLCGSPIFMPRREKGRGKGGDGDRDGDKRDGDKGGVLSYVLLRRAAIMNDCVEKL